MDPHDVPRAFFDERDHELIRIVGDIAERKNYAAYKRLLAPYLHPHGIKEMAAPQGLRIAYALAHLLGTLEKGSPQERLHALSTLRDEVLYTSMSPLRKNTARILLEMMKELLRSQGDYQRQLELAHDFRAVASGNPRLVRAQLKAYHLVEMPEAWNQVAFDDHVHDANTKGRKSPTHLIMDAWIKGIRRLTVVYYNFIAPEAARELLEAAAIMDIKVTVGIEYLAALRGKPVKVIWVPRGLTEVESFQHFLAEPGVRALMDQGREISAYMDRHVMRVFQAFNGRHLAAVRAAYGVEFEPLDETRFREFVGPGQASLRHLGTYVCERLRPLLAARVEELATRDPDSDEAARAARLLADLDADAVMEAWLRPAANPDLPDPMRPPSAPAAPGVPDAPDASDAPATSAALSPAEVPDLLFLPPDALMRRLRAIHPRMRITLNLYGLTTADVLEILYDCRGMVTHLEIFNLKDHILGRCPDNDAILELQAAINSNNVVRLKRHIAGIIQELEAADAEGCGGGGDSGGGGNRARLEARARCDKLVDILFDIPTLHSFYTAKPLRSSIGTDSTGQSGRLHGMGLVLRPSLSWRAQRTLSDPSSMHRALPLFMTAFRRVTRVPRECASAFPGLLLRAARFVPGLGRLTYRGQEEWVLRRVEPAAPGRGNLFTLGGARREGACARPRDHEGAWSPRYLKTGLKIGLKVLLGFIPAFLTFLLTKQWWLLAYGGALIWFAITGVRNIIQAVLGCGGLRRPALVRWNSYVSWNRLADSLMYTGISVPLLDYLVKTLFMEDVLGMTVGTHPLAVYLGMGLVNGAYITTHNLFRGLPRSAALANIFRCVLSVPLAVGFNYLAGLALVGVGMAAGAAAADVVLQKWAAIISKLASDCVAGIIEGLADRAAYLRRRALDYANKLERVFDTYARLEMLFPQEDVLSLLESSHQITQTLKYEHRDLLRIIIVNALDLMYFWMYQPRARDVFRRRFRAMTMEERRALLLSQHVLRREREITQLFLDGLVGRNFSKALSFYLAHYNEYLERVEVLADAE
ncbi:MAG: hypothetical protein H0S85_03130 [Desulfovibrionaceae bacterium]|nr:hypothetical protein [Desulfovibrionaceae bacterium]